METQREQARQHNVEAAQKRREAAAAGLGMFAGYGSTVDEFLAERSAEDLAKTEKWLEGQPK